MYVDSPIVLELVALLKAHGVRHVVISPGSRHYPIMRSLEHDPDFHLYSVVDERSAGFFAIGVIRATNSPVAVLTTSGTAAVNLSSPIADAYYQRLPLVAITADRFPQLLDQMEDQMVDQSNLFAGTLRSRALLRPINTDTDHWYNNRVINEALLALRINGVGPVHVNVPIDNHTGLAYSTKTLPSARVVSHHTPTSWGTDWSDVEARLRGKRVMILWGQSGPVDSETLTALSDFTSRTDSLVISDHLGNLDHSAVLEKAFASLRSGRARAGAITPDVLITMGGTLFLIEEVKALLREHEVEHWRIDPDGRIVDPFWQLTDVFQVSSLDFLSKAVSVSSPQVQSKYREVASGIVNHVPKIPDTYGELGTIGRFLERLPQDAALHIGNSAPMRMAHLYEIDPKINILGNRGVNGIDGSMSATIGYAAASGQLTFLIIGDLSFFYDMNSLWIRHRPANLRILVVNNGGGALMHSSPVPSNRAQQAALHTSAGHSDSVQGWVESMGIKYLQAHDGSSLEASLEIFMDPQSDSAIVLEAFSDKVADIGQLKDYHSSNGAVGSSTYRKVRSFTGRTLRKLGMRG
ncbi:2-succinyl-5-enolpyruvyl-6-hydroxy-3-cyclohexene-1-carboxylic-acid synthase [Nesterenkonia sp. E16_7]|uniref:2-succinyl-5-enolpyruvyl-6-hydroxy-3- cyclohexene-1-carboxylic-acid synthase n=1 Tax=unclassified Nesterenkonia TaxID=2629769 RepID=UPI001A92D713|nr:2-succinyl-5-enolpyruvyl-6-hydroxy-3-cyclohexene-1-carboxylic-acid synthase [Nesterenkonia sp. E16_10]MBO0599769.1 2-succinyl-5-enolpyruvyl-6-hydroxy-3-cyclohexene-1-carboxylic-acid synthase [Nesterenkonia sp. E16_7]